MIKYAKNTGLFLLCLAGLVIFSHEIIPHHHHFHSAFTATPFDRHEGCDDSHKPGEPIDNSENHCHAFNDITVERQTFVKIAQPHVSLFPDLFVALFLLTDAPDVDGDVSYYCRHACSNKDTFIRFPVLRRGPPIG